jgi:hypothetical protein
LKAAPRSTRLAGAASVDLIDKDNAGIASIDPISAPRRVI